VVNDPFAKPPTIEAAKRKIQQIVQNAEFPS